MDIHIYTAFDPQLCILKLLLFTVSVLPHLTSALKLAKVANRPELQSALSLGHQPRGPTLIVWENQVPRDLATRESSVVSEHLHVGHRAVVAPYG